MHKYPVLLLCILLVIGLLSGCKEEETPAATVSTAPSASETTVPPETSLPLETLVTYPDAATNTVVLRSQDAALRKTYVLMAVNSKGPFLVKDVTLNEWGANALAQWLMSDTSAGTIAAFGTETYGEPLFAEPDSPVSYAGWINAAPSAENTIRLVVENSLADTGLLEALIPEFEEAYGYTVAVQSGSAYEILNTARSGYAELVLAESGSLAQTLVTDGFTRTVPGLDAEQLPVCTAQYLLCGPKDDPAGVAEYASVTESFAAIAAGEYPFTSRGDGSNVHRLEQQFWPENQVFGSWYRSAEMEMGPCLVMNDLEGGYILTDKLTWLIYASENGII